MFLSSYNRSKLVEELDTSKWTVWSSFTESIDLIDVDILMIA